MFQLVIALTLILTSQMVPASSIVPVSISSSANVHECRLWGAASVSIPAELVTEHLLVAPYCLKSLGAQNWNGWGLGYYNASSNEPIVRNGSLPANVDAGFDASVAELAYAEARIAVGHVRLATSGFVNISDPHPFERFKNEETWLFAHNGGVNKYLLMNLMGGDYLEQNPPCVGNGTDEWVDSELYFIYILKCIEENDWNVTTGISAAATMIYAQDSGAMMNFLLTNGRTLWAFRKGYTLYYSQQPETENSSQVTAVASQYPSATIGSWTLLDDFELLEVEPDGELTIVDARTAIPEYGQRNWQVLVIVSSVSLIFVTFLRVKPHREREIVFAKEYPDCQTGRLCLRKRHRMRFGAN